MSLQTFQHKRQCIISSSDIRRLLSLWHFFELVSFIHSQSHVPQVPPSSSNFCNLSLVNILIVEEKFRSEKASSHSQSQTQILPHTGPAHKKGSHPLSSQSPSPKQNTKGGGWREATSITKKGVKEACLQSSTLTGNDALEHTQPSLPTSRTGVISSSLREGQGCFPYFLFSADGEKSLTKTQLF